MKKNRVFLILVALGILFLLFSSKNQVDRHKSFAETTQKSVQQVSYEKDEDTGV